MLTGKYRRDTPLPAGTRIPNSPKQAQRYINDENWRIIEELTAFSEKRGRTLLDLAVAWLASCNPVCSVIAGAMTPEQLDANVAATRWQLSDQEVTEIDAISMRRADAAPPL